MLAHSKNQNQASFFNPVLKDFIDPNHPLYNLPEVFPWKLFEDDSLRFILILVTHLSQ